jgi:hypothetical protein
MMDFGDKLDRVVMVKDGKGLKTFTKYDALGRVIMTGKYYGTDEPGTDMNTFEIPSSAAPHYYTTDQSFPDDGLIDVLTVNYYDDYDLSEDGTNDAVYHTPPGVVSSYYPDTNYDFVHGKATASKRRHGWHSATDTYQSIDSLSYAYASNG